MDNFVYSPASDKISITPSKYSLLSRQLAATPTDKMQYAGTGGGLASAIISGLSQGFGYKGVQEERELQQKVLDQAKIDAAEKAALEQANKEKIAALGATKVNVNTGDQKMSPYEESRLKEQAKFDVENIEQYKTAQSTLPELKNTVAELEALSDKATFRKSDQLKDFLTKEIKGEATPGAIARTELIAKVDQQVLPLMKQTFGAAFTEREGESLRKTMLDPNTTPAQKKASLKSFIAQKERDLKVKRGILGFGEAQGATESQAIQQAQSQTQAPQTIAKREATRQPTTDEIQAELRRRGIK